MKKYTHITLYCVYHNIFTFKQMPFTILGELQSKFCENLTECYQISLKILPYPTDKSTAYGMYEIALVSIGFLWLISHHIQCLSSQ